MMKRRLWKKVVTTAMAGCLLASMLTGCGGTSQEKGQSTVASGVETTDGTKEAAGTQSAENSDEAKLEDYTLDVYFCTYGGRTDDIDAVQEAMSKITKEKINADVALHCIDIGAWQTQVPLLYSSGEKIDFILTSANMAPNYSSMVGSGQLLDMKDLLDQYGGDIKETLGEFLYGATIKGGIYGVPVNKEKASSYGGFVFNAQMVKDLGLEEQVKAVKSYEDLEPLFEIAKEKIPGVTCFAMSLPDIGGYGVDPYFDRYGTDLGGVMPIDSTDYQLVDLWTSDDYSAAVNWTYDMYQKGYIDPSAVTENDNSKTNGTAFCWQDKLKEGSDKEISAQFGYDVICVETRAPYAQADQAQGIMGAIGSTSEDPERAMMFLNMLYSDAELLNTFVFGVEGLDYVKTGETYTDSLGNEITFINYPEGKDSQTVGWFNQGWAYGNEFLDYMIEGSDPERWADMAKTSDNMKISNTFGFTFDQSPVDTEISACTAIIKKYSAMNVGALDPKTTVPKMMEEMKAAGYDKIKEEKQKQIDQWVAENK